MTLVTLIFIKRNLDGVEYCLGGEKRKMEIKLYTLAASYFWCHFSDKEQFLQRESPGESRVLRTEPL